MSLNLVLAEMTKKLLIIASTRTGNMIVKRGCGESFYNLFDSKDVKVKELVVSLKRHELSKT